MRQAATSVSIESGSWQPGVITTRRLRRTQALYAALLVGGLTLYVFSSTADIQALALGLCIPGGGFLVAGPWGIAASLLTLSIFAATIFLWFAAGAIVLPLIVWGASAWIAWGIAGTRSWIPAPYVAVATCLACTLWIAKRNRGRATLGRQSIAQRATVLTQVLEGARAMACAERSTSPRELSDEDLANMRYMLDRALQPVDGFNGFDSIDIFQTAAIRYQLNYLGYGLSLLQRHYTPNFHGYLSQAQRNAIAKYLQPRVWNYWIYESILGHLNFRNWDPARKDNIMLTGYLGAQVALYIGTTGDRGFEQPGSLEFRLGKHLAWKHNVHTIVDSVVSNFNRSAYCLYPCEPNWIYAGCNFRGMTTLAAYDRAFGTRYVDQVRDRFLSQLDSEFTTPAGGVIGLKSSLTGIEFPFPSSDLGYCLTTNTFAPERALRMWAIVQFGMRRLLGRENGVQIIQLPNRGIDFGNYKRGNLTFAMAALLAASREFGDEELAEAALATLNMRCGRIKASGVVHFRSGSNLANLYVAGARALRCGDYRDGFTSPMPRSALMGPLLSEARYPDVLVARAVSDGQDLDLVLAPGREDIDPQVLRLTRLTPHRQYTVEGRPDAAFSADAQGEAKLSLTLSNRTRLHVVPVN